MQSLGLRMRDRVGSLERMQPRHVQGLIRVDVAQSGDKSLIEQEWFQVTLPRVKTRVQPLRGEGRAQRFRPESASHHLGLIGQPDSAELASVIEDQAGLACHAVFSSARTQRLRGRGELQDQAVVFFGARPARLNHKIPAHPQVNEKMRS